MTYKVILDDMSTIKKFVSLTQDMSESVTLSSGRYIIDGKSILGILSLDLSKPVTMTIDSSNDYTELFEDFLYKN